MKVKVNDLIFDCEILTGFQNIVVIDLDKYKSDFQIFKDWYESTKTDYASIYKRNLELIKPSGEIYQLIGCFPIISFDEKFVKIIYDYYKIENS